MTKRKTKLMALFPINEMLALTFGPDQVLPVTTCAATRARPRASHDE